MALSGIFKEMIVVDVVIYSEYKEAVWWGTRAMQLKVKRRDSYDGDIYSGFV